MNATTTTTEARKFETMTCGRCGGSGNYSYCVRYGTTCFGCQGTGKKYTKRGFAAKTYFEGLCEVEARDLIVGNAIKQIGVTMGGDVYAKFSTITDIKIATEEDEKNGSKYWVSDENGPDVLTFRGEPEKRGRWMPSTVVGDYVVTTKMMTLTLKPTGRVRLAQCSEAKAAKLEMAYDYQETLTKTGTPRKNAKS